ncbi:MAG TPA: transcriptional regulator [Anaerolineae bacterium]|nr:transcriptional regulator [Anaerolineae bacterium]
MRKHLVVTVTGADKPGIVEHVTKLLLHYQGNVEASKMARLGGEFAMLMMLSAPEDNFNVLRDGLRQLRDEGYAVTTRQTERGYSAKYTGWLPYRLEVKGADHEGIIHQLTGYLAKHQINIETMDTDVVKAPMSGAPLFTMDAIIVAPPELSYQNLKESLATIGDELGVDADVSPYVG